MTTSLLAIVTIVMHMQIPRIMSQINSVCIHMEPICITDQGLDFTILNTQQTAPSGNNYDCLSIQRDPTWYYLKINSSNVAGDLYMDFSAPHDIDFIIYGPFQSVAVAQSMCGSLGTGNISFNAVADCSYSTTNAEKPHLSGVQPNEIYTVLITSYAETIQTVSLRLLELKSTAFTDCSITPKPTTMPTSDPTVNTLCGTNKHCLYKDIYPKNNEITQFSVAIKANDDYSATYFEIHFTAKAESCVRPLISFEYELIDYDQTNEYIQIYDNTLNLINSCSGGRNCGEWDTNCINHYDLGINKININNTYKITMVEGSEVDSLCSDELTLNAKLTLHCDAGSAVPTIEPTTSQPTPPSTEPTALPTTSITVQVEGTLFCGDSIRGSTTASQRIHYYKFITPPYTVSVLFDSCGSGYDTYLYFYEPHGTPIACCDDCGNCGTRTQLPVFTVNSGDYVLGIGGYHSLYGAYSMSVSCNIPVIPGTFQQMQTTFDFFSTSDCFDSTDDFFSTFDTSTVPPSSSTLPSLVTVAKTSTTGIIISDTALVIIICVIVILVILMLSAVYIRRLRRKLKQYKSVRTEEIPTNEENEGAIEAVPIQPISTKDVIVDGILAENETINSELKGCKKIDDKEKEEKVVITYS